MSITDELRLFAADPYTGWVPTDKQQADLRAIADRIDAEHESALRETGEKIVGDVRKEWMPLPVDADGVPICVGDVMEWIDLDGEVTVTCSVDAVGVDCFFAWDKGNRRYAQKCANAYRHHHAPTVEDVLREMLDAWGDLPSNATNEAIVAEYAAKLRLAESEDA